MGTNYGGIKDIELEPAGSSGSRWQCIRLPASRVGMHNNITVSLP